MGFILSTYFCHLFWVLLIFLVDIRGYFKRRMNIENKIHKKSLKNIEQLDDFIDQTWLINSCLHSNRRNKNSFTIES